MRSEILTSGVLPTVSLMLLRGGPYPSPLFLSDIDEDLRIELAATVDFTAECEAGEINAEPLNGADNVNALLSAAVRYFMLLQFVFLGFFRFFRWVMEVYGVSYLT